MKNKFTILLLSAFMAFTFSANAVKAAEGIAILDVEKIAKEAKAVRDIQKKVSKKQDQFQKEINTKQEALESEQKKLEAKRNILSKEAFEKEQKDFSEKVEKLKEFVEKRQASLKKASTASMENVNEKMKVVVEEVAKEKKLSLILPSSQVIYSLDGFEITDEVLKRLDKKVSTVDVKFE